MAKVNMLHILDKFFQFTKFMGTPQGRSVEGMVFIFIVIAWINVPWRIGQTIFGATLIVWGCYYTLMAIISLMARIFIRLSTGSGKILNRDTDKEDNDIGESGWLIQVYLIGLTSIVLWKYWPPASQLQEALLNYGATLVLLLLFGERLKWILTK